MTKHFEKDKIVEIDEEAFDKAVRHLYSCFNIMSDKKFDDLDLISKEEFQDAVWFTLQVYLQNKRICSN